MPDQGLLFEMQGRLQDLVKLRSASRKVLAVMDRPRSAWVVNSPGVTPWLASLSANSSLNKITLWVPAMDDANQDIPGMLAAGWSARLSPFGHPFYAGSDRGRAPTKNMGGG